jgi:putative ABC transport system ATP-binding protein
MLKATNVSKSFGSQVILNNLSLELTQGTSLAIVGKSGIGKSTLLNILGTLESYDNGQIFIDGQLVTEKNSDQLRQNHIGFIFQNFNVLEDFSLIDNLKLASWVRKEDFKTQKALEILEKVELKNKAQLMAKVLSGGERQRLAIARALMHTPKIIFADEPTGSLDGKQSEMIEELLLKGVKLGQTSLVIVTHDLELAKKCDRILLLKDGILKEYI